MTAADIPSSVGQREGTPRAPGRRWHEFPVLLAFLAVLASAVAAALLLAPSSPADNSPEAGFARDMSVHHAQAVEMALIVRDRTRDPELRALATDIMLTQQAQGGQMQGWLDAWRLGATGGQPAMAWMGSPVPGLMPGMAGPEQIAHLATDPPDVMDLEFARLMIRHHQTGVAMANAVLDRTDRPEVRRLAGAIVASQQSEIEALRQFMDRKGAPPAVDGPAMSGGMAPEHAGFFTSALPVARDTVRLGPLALAAFALAWLGLDTARRYSVNAISAVDHSTVPLPWRAVAAAGLVVSGVLHLGLAPAHFADSVAYGLFFVAVGLALPLAAAAVLAWPSRLTYLTGGALSAALVPLYLFFRLVPPPGAAMPEEFDVAGIVAKVTEVAAASACAVLYARSSHDRSAQVGGHAGPGAV